MPTIDVVDPETGAITPWPLPETRLSWIAVPEADALQLVLREEGRPVLHAEIEAPEPAGMEISFGQRPSGAWFAEAADRRVLVMPPGDLEQPSILALRPWRRADLFFLIDGTVLHPGPDSQEPTPLVGSNDWEPWASRLREFGSALETAGWDVQVGLGAFGDLPASSSANGYLRFPEVWRLTTPGRAVGDWALLRPTDGGDFIDALADGLYSCRFLKWRSDVRRMVMIFGDSPGYSVIDAHRSPIDLADSQLRQYDVFEEALALHQRGVELATVYHDPSANALRLYDDSLGLLGYAREQYERLATRNAWALTSSAFSSAAFAKEWMAATGPVARGAAPPLRPR